MNHEEVVKQEEHAPVKQAVAARLLVLAAIWFMTCFMTPLPGDNVNTRLNLVTSIVRYHSLRIDAYHLNTLDKAFVDGHYYSDKAPGTSIMALPAAYVYNLFSPARPDDPVYLLLVTALAVSLPAAFMIYLFFALCSRASGSASTAILLTASLVFATLFLPYSTLLFGHVTGAAISFTVFYLACMSKTSPPLKMLVAGFLCSWLVIVEYPMAVHSVVLGVLLVLNRKNRRSIPFLAPGIIICAAILFSYNKAAFGDWFTLGYFHETWQEFQEGHSKGLAGLTYPHISSLYEIILKPGMGLLFLSPFLLFAIPGFVSGLKIPEWRGAVVTAGIISLIGILINASHFVPMGGMAPGPRHLVTVMPYLVFLCSFFLKSRNPFRMGFYIGLSAVSAVIHIMLTVTDPQTPRGFDIPALEYSMAHILKGLTRPAWFSVVSKLSDSISIIIIVLITVLLVLAAYSAVRNRTHNRPFIAALSAVAAVVFSVGMWSITYRYYSKNEVVKKKYFLAYSYRLLGRTDLAKEGYREVLELHPTHALAHFGLGKLAMSENDYQTAIKHFRETVAVYPSLSEAQYNLANLLFKTEEYDEAYERYALSIETEKMGNVRQQARSYAALAAISLIREEPVEADALLNHAKTLFPGDPFIEIVEERMQNMKKETRDSTH